MKKYLLPLCSVLALSLTFTSCKKDKKEDPAPSTTDLLTNKNWVLTAETSDPPLPVGGTSVTDVYAQLDACDKDDIMRFSTPNVVTFDEGADKCSATSPQTTTGTWVLSTDQKTVTVTQGTNNESYSILSLTNSELKVKYILPGSTVNYAITATFAAR